MCSREHGPLYGSETKPAHSPRDGRKPTQLLLGNKRSARPADPRTHPRTRGPFSARMDPGLTQGCLINYTSLRINAFRTLWEHRLSLHQETCSSHCWRIHVLWCSLEHKNIPDTKMHGQSPLGYKVSSCSVYLCYLFIDTGCAWYGHYHWNL